MRGLIRHAAVVAGATVVVGTAPGAAGAGGPAQAASRYPYTLVDPGTFGGPQNYLNLPAVPLTPNGMLLGSADTTTPDASYPNVNPFTIEFPDGNLAHAFEWQNGHLGDLGALPGNNSSAVFEVNGSGVGVGASETTVTDPYTGWPAEHATMFTGGKVTDLGTLPAGYESQANDINDRGQVSGFASNGTPDPYSFFSWGTQARSFIWHNGVMRDIGTLGGPDAVSTTLNARGQITGQSYTNATANPATGVPTLDPFLWQNGHMRDLGTLGGTFAMANWINSPGDVVGFSLTADQAFRGFLWRHGTMTDLPPVGGAPWAFANALNDRGQVVGNARDTQFNELIAVLWAGGRGYDLNTLVAPNPLQMVTAEYINNQGDIVGGGVLPNGDRRIFLLIRNPSVPLPQTRAPLRPLPATGLPDRSASVILAIHATRHGGIAAGIRQLRHAAAMRIRP